MEARGEINGMRSLDGVYGPLIRRARTVRGVHVDLVQAKEYRWRVGGWGGWEGKSVLLFRAPPSNLRSSADG